MSDDEKDQLGGDGVFSDVNPYSAITRVESMCVECEENGITNFMLTKIPFFREIIISRFECRHCGYSNVGIDPATQIQEFGRKITLRVSSKEDLNRQVVKSDSCIIQIPHLEFEIPARTQKGTLTTIEGIITTAYDNLNLHQSARQLVDPDAAAKVEVFLEKLKACLEVNEPFVFIADDPAGNSYIANPFAPKSDPELIEFDYERTQEQNSSLGISTEVADREMFRREREHEELAKLTTPADEVGVSSVRGGDEFARPSGSKVATLTSENITTAMQAADLEKDVVSFEVPCPSCPQMGRQRMVKIDIPYFKEVVVMSYVCDYCGQKNNEVKAGGAIAPQGKRYKLDVLNKADLSRDILKSETADILIPEIDLEMGYGSMGGQFTTVEGLVTRIRKDLMSNPFAVGDSSDMSAKERFERFFTSLDKYRKGEEPFTLILDDPVANSYVQNLCAPDPDPQLQVTYYTRTFEQDEDLGLNDMVTEGYYKEEGGESKEEKSEKKEDEVGVKTDEVD